MMVLVVVCYVVMCVVACLLFVINVCCLVIMIIGIWCCLLLNIGCRGWRSSYVVLFVVGRFLFLDCGSLLVFLFVARVGGCWLLDVACVCVFLMRVCSLLVLCRPIVSLLFVIAVVCVFAVFVVCWSASLFVVVCCVLLCVVWPLVFGVC